jgi:hypothetical protein
LDGLDLPFHASLHHGLELFEDYQSFWFLFQKKKVHSILGCHLWKSWSTLFLPLKLFSSSHTIMCVLTLGEITIFLGVSFLESTPTLFTSSTIYVKIKLAINLSIHSNDCVRIQEKFQILLA